MSVGYYKALLPRDMVVSMALMYLPKDGTEWIPLLHEAHMELSKSPLPIAAAADVPTVVARGAFERMGYQYMEVEKGAWRRRLSSVAADHWNMLREHNKDYAS